jgi:hypothetical protein
MKFRILMIHMILFSFWCQGWAEDFSKEIAKGLKLSVQATFKKICAAETVYFMEEQVDSKGRAAPRRFLSAASPDEWQKLNMDDPSTDKIKYSVTANGEEEKATMTLQAHVGSTTYQSLGVAGKSGSPKCNPVE